VVRLSDANVGLSKDLSDVSHCAGKANRHTSLHGIVGLRCDIAKERKGPGILWFALWLICLAYEFRATWAAVQETSRDFVQFCIIQFGQFSVHGPVLQVWFGPE